MMKAFLLPAISWFLVFSLPVAAQEPFGQTDENEAQSNTGRRRFWQANLSGGSYLVLLERISSVSRHRYLLNGNLMVDEVTIDTLGQALARFYFIRPITPGQAGEVAPNLTGAAEQTVGQAEQTAGVNVRDMVVKTYPDSTHARTVEYRLLSEKELTDLFNSVQTSWQTGRGRVFPAGSTEGQ